MHKTIEGRASRPSDWSCSFVPRDRIELSTRGFSIPTIPSLVPKKRAVWQAEAAKNGNSTSTLPKRRMAEIPIVLGRGRKKAQAAPPPADVYDVLMDDEPIV